MANCSAAATPTIPVLLTFRQHKTPVTFLNCMTRFMRLDTPLVPEEEEEPPLRPSPEVVVRYRYKNKNKISFMYRSATLCTFQFQLVF